MRFAKWIVSYNEKRPHDALGNLPPTVYRERLLAGAKFYFATVYLTGKLTAPPGGY
jgi:Integrase core domain